MLVLHLLALIFTRVPAMIGICIKALAPSSPMGFSLNSKSFIAKFSCTAAQIVKHAEWLMLLLVRSRY